jgi:hypothetical protein
VRLNKGKIDWPMFREISPIVAAGGSEAGILPGFFGNGRELAKK